MPNVFARTVDASLAACASLEARRTALSASGASEGEGGAAHLAAQRECRRLEARLGRAALLAARHQRAHRHARRRLHQARLHDVGDAPARE